MYMEEDDKLVMERGRRVRELLVAPLQARYENMKLPTIDWWCGFMDVQV